MTRKEIPLVVLLLLALPVAFAATVSLEEFDVGSKPVFLSRGDMPPTIETARGHLRKAEAYFLAGDLSAAVRELEAGRRFLPGDDAISLALGELYNATGRFDAAIDIGRSILARRPEMAQPHDIIGSAFLRQGKLDPAIAEFRLVIERAPEQSIGHAHLGDALWVAGRPAEALKRYEDALARDPGSLPVRLKRSAVLIDQGRLDDAVAEARKATAAAPRSGMAHVVLGEALLASKAETKALQSFTEAIRLQPELARAHAGLGEVLLRQRKHGEAIAAFQRAVAIDPGRIATHAALARLYGQTGKSALQKYHLGFMALVGGDTSTAIANYRAAIRLDPNLKGAHVDLASAYLQRGEPGQAAAAALAALQIDGRDPLATVLLGRARSAQGKLQDAERQYRTALKLNPGFLPAYLHLGDLLRTTKRCPDALVIYEQALSRGARGESIAQGIAVCESGSEQRPTAPPTSMRGATNP